MALTRKMLKAMGIEDEKIDEIIEAHAETVDALKEQRDTYKADADKLAVVQKKLDETTEKLNGIKPEESEAKYNELKKQFDDYKAGVAEKETTATKTKAYRELLGKVGIKGDKLIDTILRGVDLKGVEIDENGIKDADKLTESLKTEWKDYISTTETKGASVDNPPAATTRIYTRDEIRNMSPAEINQNYEAIKASLKKGT
jgi:hypothetical protein